MVTRNFSKKNIFKRIIASRNCYFFMAPYALIFLIFTIVPVFIAIYYSLTSFNILETPTFISLENYERLFLKDKLFVKALINTLTFAAILGPGGYILSLSFAWFLNELNKRMRSVLTLLFYAPSLCNVYVMWKIIFSGDQYGYLNANLMKLGITYEPILWLQDERYIKTVLIIVLLWASLGTSFLSFIAGFQTIDTTLYEVAAVDGIRNRWQELWYITLPAMKPQLMFGAIMSISSSFSVGDQISALVGFPSPNYSAHTLVAHLQDYGNTRFEMGYACAIAVVLFVIMVFSNKAIQKIIQKVGE